MKAAVEKAHGCYAMAASSASVLVNVDRDRGWSGSVHIFSLTGHAETDTAYAWLDAGKIYTALMIEPIISPADAIRAWLTGGSTISS